MYVWINRLQTIIFFYQYIGASLVVVVVIVIGDVFSQNKNSQVYLYKSLQLQLIAQVQQIYIDWFMDKLIADHYIFYKYIAPSLVVVVMLSSHLFLFLFCCCCCCCFFLKNYISLITYNILLLHKLYDCTLSNLQINMLTTSMTVNFYKMIET